MVITLLFNTVAFAAVTTKSHEIKIDNVKSQIDQAATAQAIAYLMKKCVPVVTGYGGGNDSWDHTGWSNDIFLGSGETTDMSSGPWLEKEIQGKVDDGEVYCKNGGGVAEKQAILTLFSNLVGAGGPSYIMCNKENRGYPGLIALWKNDKRHNWDCDQYGVGGGGEYSYNTGVGDFTVYGQKYSNGEEYVRILYNHWVDSQNNPYLLHWDDDLSDFTVDGNEGARGYYIVRHDFEAQCGSKSVPKGTYGAVYIQDIDDKGKETETYYEPTGDKKDSAVTNITGTRKRTCSQIADSLSGGYKTYFTEYRKALYDAFKNECKKGVESAWDFKKRQADIILDDNPEPQRIEEGESFTVIDGELKSYGGNGNVWQNYTEDGDGNKTVIEFTDEDKTSAKELLNLYNEYKTNSFVTPKTADESPWVCNAPEGYIVTMEEYQDPTEGVTDDGGTVELTCANSGGAESLGWIVCPILEWMGNAANDVYNDYVAPSLEVEPQLFSQNPDEGTRDAWGVFQSLANICFIILVLIVIFSQLTGVGIDNYGIKKILPKLIVTAVLVNLSYLICLICVDLSNILGNALQALFDGLSTGTPTLNIPDSNANLGSAGTTVLTGVAVLAALVVMVGAVWKNPAILLSLLVAALGIVIAIFFLFILLSARQAAIIVLTVVSPIAFVSYILPNTKKLFDKWLKFWEGLLLVYPICGLLIGGGDYVSRLLLSAGFAKGGFISAFTAMIVGVLPIFFIPTVLKGAFAAMGAIGSRITGFGDRMRGGATRGLRNSEGYKNIQERGRETGIRRRAGYDSKGRRKWGEEGPSRFQRFVRGGRRNIQRNALAYQKLRSEKGSLEATDGSDYMLATETANEAKRIVANGEINNNARMQSSLYSALMSNDRAKIRAYTDALSGKGEDGRQAVKAAYNQAVGAGLGRTEAGRNAAQTFANNILANHGADYKNNNRSMFETAKNINQTQGQAVTDTNSYLSAAENRAKLAGKVTATTIGNMDDDAFGEVFGGYNNKAVSIPAGADAKEIGAAAYAALSSQNANIKAERRSYLEQIVKASGYTPEAQNVNVTNMPKPLTPESASENETFKVQNHDPRLDVELNSEEGAIYGDG